MPIYLVETYLTPRDRRQRATREGNARRAAAELTRQGTPVRFDGLLDIPDDELCFVSFDTATAELAELAARRAGIDPLRVVRAISSAQAGSHQPPNKETT